MTSSLDVAREPPAARSRSWRSSPETATRSSGETTGHGHRPRGWTATTVAAMPGPPIASWPNSWPRGRRRMVHDAGDGDCLLNPGMNEFIFPEATAAPFFDADADDAANDGGIGAVIGHEIGHGFDDQGRSTTATARSLVDRRRPHRVRRRTKALIAQDHESAPRGRCHGHHVNGSSRSARTSATSGAVHRAGPTSSAAKARRPRHRRPDRRAAGVLGWAQVWRTNPRCGSDPAARRRPALAAGVPLQRRGAQHGRVRRGVRRRPGRRPFRQPQRRVGSGTDVDPALTRLVERPGGEHVDRNTQPEHSGNHGSSNGNDAASTRRR